MPPGPEDIAREQIDRMLEQAGWSPLEYNPAIPIEIDKGNDFCQKITYKTTGRKPEDLIAEFRTSPMPRIAVTVDMIATGTDIKPLEVVLFMRSVKSRSFFEQMKGRGVRVIHDDDLKAVTPDARTKDHFIIVDAVGVCEQGKTDSRPMEKKPSVSFEKLLLAVA
jgi:type I restriction enzyme R subunit